MAFCENCGRPLAEGEVCNCTQGQTGNMPNQPGNAGTAKKGKKGLLIAILVLIVAVAGGVAIILNLTNSYKKPVDKIVSLANKRTTKLDSIASAVLPDFATSSYKKAVKILKSSDDFAEAFDSAEESISELYDEFDDEYDDGWKVKFDCADKEKFDSDELENADYKYSALYSSYFESICDDIKDYDKYDYEDIADSLGISKSKAKDLCKVAINFMNEFKNAKVTAGYTLTGRVVVNDKSGDTIWKSDKMALKVIKLNGDWMIDYLSLMSDEGISIWDLESMIGNFY